MAIEIWTASDLNNVRNNLSGEYIQMVDIDLGSFSNWEPLGILDGGVYDGNQKRIVNLKITRPLTDQVGLFSELQNSAIVKNLFLEGEINGALETGSISGRVWNYSVIKNCHFNGKVVGSRQIGGIVGSTSRSGRVQWSSSRGSVESTDSGSSSGYGTGGIIGYLSGVYSPSGGWVEYCWSLATVTGTASGGNAHQGTGGIVGYTGSGGQIHDCWCGGKVQGGSQKGGIVGGVFEGGNNLYNCYSYAFVEGSGTYIGGIIGRQAAGSIVNSYYDVEKSGQSDDRGTPLETVEMVYPYLDPGSVYVEWDFDTIWKHDVGHLSNYGYPFLLFPSFLTPGLIVYPKVGGHWKRASAFVKKGGSWLPVSDGWIKKGGVWKPIVN